MGDTTPQIGQVLTHFPFGKALQSALAVHALQSNPAEQNGLPLSSRRQAPSGFWGQSTNWFWQRSPELTWHPAAPLVGRHVPFRQVPEQQLPFGFVLSHGFLFRRQASASSAI